MEIYSSTTRFCFACNQSNKIIDPIQSRCAILRYGKLTDEEVLRRLKEVCDAEDVSFSIREKRNSPFSSKSEAFEFTAFYSKVGLTLTIFLFLHFKFPEYFTFSFQVKFSSEGLASLVFTSEGDMRQAINNLQSTWTGLGFVSPDNVFKVCDQPHPLIIKEILMACYVGDIEKAMEKLREVWDKGYAAVDIVTNLFRVVKTLDRLDEKIKVSLRKMQKIEMRRCDTN